MNDNKTYPYHDGDVSVLGPDIFVDLDGHTISWKGENFVPQAAGAVTVVAEETILHAVHRVAATVDALADAAGDHIGQADEDADADQLTVRAQAAANLAQAADLWTGIGVGLTEMRQRVLAGADRTIKVEGGEQQ